MSGELTLSQFKNTTTSNNDFVIGNPIPVGVTDTSDRYLIFQVSDKIGPSYNPHVKCEFTSGGWRIKLSDNGVTDNDFAFLNVGTSVAPQVFVGVNEFSGPVLFTGLAKTKSIELGQVPEDVVTFKGSPNFTGPVTFSSATTFTNDVTVNAPSKAVVIDALRFETANKTLLLNKGKATAAGGNVGITVDNDGTVAGYVKTLADNTGWEFKAPGKNGTIVLSPSSDAGTMTFKPINGTFGVNNSRTYEFLDASGKVGTFPNVPVGDRIVLSTPTGFKESAITATTLSYLDVTSSVSGLLSQHNSLVFALNSRMDTAESNITFALDTLATEDSTTSSLIAALDSRVTGVEASVTSSLNTFASELDAQASDITTLTATVGTNTSAISNEAIARANADSAEAAARLSLASSIPGIADARIASALSTYSDATKASAQSVIDLTATVSNNAATAHSELLAYVGPGGTTTSSITSLGTTVGNHTTTLSQYGNSINGLEANWGVTITTTSNGVANVSGIKLNSDPTGTSTFSIMANKFELVDPGDGTGNTKLIPFSYSGGKVYLNSQVIFSSPGVAPGATLSNWVTDLAALTPGTTVIDGGRILTNTVVAASLLSDFSITNVIRSNNYVAPNNIGTGLAATTAPTGFKLSGTPYPTRFIGDTVDTNVQFEIGTNANFGGYKVGKVTDKVFAAPAVAFYSSQNNTVQYPFTINGTPMTFVEGIRSGISVSQLSGGGIQAQATGIYTIDLHMQQHGSGLSSSYMNCYIAVKRAANLSAGFAEVIFHDWNFFGGGKSEAHVGGTAVVNLQVGDIIGVYYDAPGMSYINAWLSMSFTGEKSASDVLTITVADTVTKSATSTTFPQTHSIPLTATNAIGSMTWSLDSGGLDGTTSGTMGATAVINGSNVDVTYTVAPTYGDGKNIKLRVMDSEGHVATKTISIVLTSVASVSITTAATTNKYTDTFPYDASITLSATGGSGTYTWTVTDAGNTGASTAGNIFGNVLTLTAPTDGAWYCTVKATDTANSGNFATKVITFNVIFSDNPKDWVPCFAAGTYVLMSDGSSKLIEDMAFGDLVVSIDANAHQSGSTTLNDAKVLSTGNNPGDHKMYLVNGISATSRHPWGVTEPESGARLWVGSEFLKPSMQHRTITITKTTKRQKLVDTPATVPTQGQNAPVVYNMRTSSQSYFVGTSPAGPFFLVHNLSVN